MATKTKPKRWTNGGKHPPKQPQKQKSAKPKPAIFDVGDKAEFHFNESVGGVRPQGDAEILKADATLPKGRRMYQIKVLKRVVGDPKPLMNPDKELWALDEELFKPGTRAKLEEAAAFAAVTKGDIAKADISPKQAAPNGAALEKKPPAGLPADFRRLKEQTGGALLLFRCGRLYEAFNGDAAVVAKALRLTLGQREEVAAVEIHIDDVLDCRKKLVEAGHRVGMCEVARGEGKSGHECEQVVDGTPVKRDEYLEGILKHGEPKPEADPNAGAGSACLAKEESIAAACVILFEETKGHCGLIQLAGKFKLSARKQIAAKLLGREPAHDENGVSFLREEFRGALEIDKKLTGDEADERIAARAIEIVKAIDQNEAALAADAVSPGSSRLLEQENPSEEPSGEHGAAGAAADTSQPANESDEATMKTSIKSKKTSKQPKAHANGKAHHNGKAPTVKAKSERGLSLLDAAAKVLERRSNPMTTKELVAEVVERKLWTPGEGKTPDQTLSAAIGTEINKKGKESRFKKDSPGKFLLK